jgi:hypothetical protein
MKSQKAKRNLSMIRDYTAADKAQLEQIHRKSGLDYRFPDLDHPLFFVRKVAEEDGEIKGASVLKLCAETMLLLGEGVPRERFETIKSLQDAVLAEAYLKGLGEIYADVPEIGFDKRLRQLGWEKDRPGWSLWSRSTERNT